MNDLTRLLRRTADTGILPTAAEISAILNFGTKRERDDAFIGIRVAAKKVRAANVDARDSGESAAALIDEIIGDASEKFTAVVGLDSGAQGPASARDDAEVILASRGAEDRDSRLAAARHAKSVREPLREILALSGPQRGLDVRDLDGIALRADLSNDQRAAFRAEAQRAADRIAKLYSEGQHSASRAVAEEAAVKLSGSLASGEAHRDPHADTTDPRELASAIRGGRPV